MKTKNQGRTFSIRTALLTFSIIATCLTAGVSLSMNFYVDRQFAESAAKNVFATMAEKIDEHIRAMDSRSGNIVNQLTRIEQLISKHDKKNRHQKLVLLTSIMKKNKLLYSVYITSPDGTFFQVINPESNANIRKNEGAVSQDRWIVVDIDEHNGKKIRTARFLDRSLGVRTLTHTPTTFDPTKRPWYQMALKNPGLVRTPPYFFSPFPAMGMSYTRKLDGSGIVITVDILLNELNTLLNNETLLPRSQAIIFNDVGTVIAHNSMQPKDRIGKESTQTWNPAVIRKLPHHKLQDIALSKDQRGTIQILDIEGESHFAYVEELSKLHGGREFIGFLAPVADTLKPYMKDVYIAMLAILGMLLLLIPLIWKMAGFIINPINALARESEKIKQRRYSDVSLVPSTIKEITVLSQSLISMASSIGEHVQMQHNLQDSFIRLIAEAIDQKSPYTGGHCKRVPKLSAMIAQAASDTHTGPLKNFALVGDEQWREFLASGWLHDCGKVTTPEYIMDKATRLETITNRIHEIRTRFEVLLRDAEITYWKTLAMGTCDPDKLADTLRATQQELQEEFAFVAECNIGSEFMNPEKMERIRTIAQRTWIRTFDNRLGLSHVELQRYPSSASPLPFREHLLADRPEHIIPRPVSDKARAEASGFTMDIPEELYNQGEIYNLCIPSGTLTPEDRYKINEHVIATIRMLETLPYPANLARIPEYAGAHHETLIGTGYPRKLKGEQISIPARILALADVFEALTASDRPYKEAKKLSEAVKILHSMVKDEHIDADLFHLFLSSGVYLDYARKFLKPAQIDHVDIEKYLC
ncbi:hypothetical protein JWG39_14480 [Desulforhopalus vacuolatus]|uniref:HD domain-containing phosphohydrolase n=1 Tax=Desulforhopalus vacuolatus TaxID=40414 RepID=UPI0019664CF5|nr:HD domain-containing phosphohydrolase [Desulforhopalus vacuolatus]MBM9521024.1 hypothetical protein [Desulforhopalus vacuolatus]